jgi:Protein of unknown function (DUF2889)
VVKKPGDQARRAATRPTYHENMVFEEAGPRLSAALPTSPTLPTLAPPPNDPVPLPPPRRPDSVRRTSTVLMSWPSGPGGELRLDGRARDLLTPRRGEPEVLTETELQVVTGRERDIRHIEARPPHPGLARLVGSRAGGNLRAAIAAELPAEAEAGSPLYLLLDDLAGSTLISGFALFLWADEFPDIRARFAAAGSSRVMRDICSGFRDGSSALTPEGTIAGISQNTGRPGPLVDPADPMGWHEQGDHPAMAMRRARRIDVWEEGGAILVDALFRDSCWNPEGAEEVVHEYEISGAAEPATWTLTQVVANPRVLPYAECPGAAPNAVRMEGADLRAMRRTVLDRLRNTDCCTHLNDGLRALAEVPVLAASLP